MLVLIAVTTPIISSAYFMVCMLHGLHAVTFNSFLCLFFFSLSFFLQFLTKSFIFSFIYALPMFGLSFWTESFLLALQLLVSISFIIWSIMNQTIFFILHISKYFFHPSIVFQQLKKKKSLMVSLPVSSCPFIFQLISINPWLLIHIYFHFLIFNV